MIVDVDERVVSGVYDRAGRVILACRMHLVAGVLKLCDDGVPRKQNESLPRRDLLPCAFDCRPLNYIPVSHILEVLPIFLIFTASLISREISFETRDAVKIK